MANGLAINFNAKDEKRMLSIIQNIRSVSMVLQKGRAEAMILVPNATCDQTKIKNIDRIYNLEHTLSTKGRRRAILLNLLLALKTPLIVYLFVVSIDLFL
jgi:hypothetical protein